MNKSDYTTKAFLQLNDKNHYELIIANSTTDITNKVIQEYEKIKYKITSSKLTKDQKQQLIKHTRPYANTTRFPKIYFNPKTHKEGIPLRPITSGINWATEQAAILLDEILKPLIFAHKHIPKDTFDFIKIIEKEQFSILTENHNNLYLVSFDVIALYTVIPNEEAINRVTKIINEQYFTDTPNKIPTTIFTEITRYLLNNNYFTFQNNIYKQTHGVAMGTPSGGSIANTYMLTCDTSIKTSAYNQYINTYARYFDDGFLIWNGPEQQLINFISFMNTIDKNIQITATYGKTLVYLDIDLKLTDHNILLTRTYRKSTASETYLDYRSSHPKHLKDNLPISIFTRSFIICNTQTSFNTEKDKIIQRFKNSHFPGKVITTALNKTIAKHNIPTTNNQPLYIQSRLKALENIGKRPDFTETTSQSDIYLPITHWPHKPIKQNFNKQTWSRKLNNCRIKFKKPTVSFKQPPNLLRLLTTT